VALREIIPETHRNGHQPHATLGLMTGFANMMASETALARAHFNLRRTTWQKLTPNQIGRAHV
jgi:hypothetical protein